MSHPQYRLRRQAVEEEEKEVEELGEEKGQCRAPATRAVVTAEEEGLEEGKGQCRAPAIRAAVTVEEEEEEAEEEQQVR